MKFDEVSSQGWPIFGDQFAAQHRGWLVTLQSPTGDTVVHQQPLRSLLVEGHALTVDCGEAGEHLAHRIANLERIEIERTADGRDRGVRLITTDGEWTLRFRTAAAPETVGMSHFAH